MLETTKSTWDELKPHPGNAIALGGFLLILGLCFVGIKLEEKFGFRAYHFSYGNAIKSGLGDNVCPCPPTR